MTECESGVKYDRVATASATDIRKVNISGLKKHTAYKCYVQAWVKQNGKKVYVAKSPLIHALTGNTYNNRTNAKQVTVNRSSFSLTVGGSAKIRAKVVGVKSGANVLDHGCGIRYYSTDNGVATVNSSGQIVAKGKGSCDIYVIASSGVYARVTVTVK